MKNEQDKNPENTHTTEPSEHVNSSDNGALKDGARSQDEYANGTPLIRTSPLRSHRRQQEEPWPEPVDGRALLDALCRVLGRFVVLPPWAQEVLALWTLHTYAFELRDITTYIGIESPEKRCGKTTPADPAQRTGQSAGSGRQHQFAGFFPDHRGDAPDLINR